MDGDVMEGISYLHVVAIAKRNGFVDCNQYDMRPRAIRFRRAIYKAVKKGLLVRQNGSKPSHMVYRPVLT